MRRVLTVGMTYTGEKIDGVEIDKLYADFSKPEDYEVVLGKLLRRLRIA